MAISATISGPTTTTVGGVTTNAYTLTFDLTGVAATSPLKIISSAPYINIPNGIYTSFYTGSAVDFSAPIYNTLYDLGMSATSTRQIDHVAGVKFNANGSYFVTQLIRYTSYTRTAGGEVSTRDTIDVYITNQIITTSTTSGWVVGWKLDGPTVALLSGIFTSNPSHIILYGDAYGNYAWWHSETPADDWTPQPFWPAMDSAIACNNIWNINKRSSIGANTHHVGSAGVDGALSTIGRPRAFYFPKAAGYSSYVGAENDLLAIFDGANGSSPKFGRASMLNNPLLRFEYYHGAAYSYILHGRASTAGVQFEAYGADGTQLGIWNESASIPFAYNDGSNYYAGLVSLTPSASVPAGTRFLIPTIKVTAGSYTFCQLNSFATLAMALPFPTIDGSTIMGRITQ